MHLDLLLLLLLAALFRVTWTEDNCPAFCTCRSEPRKPGDRGAYVSAKCTGLNKFPNFSPQTLWWRIEINGGEISSLPVRAIGGVHVVKLDLSNNKLENLEPGVFGDVIGLKSLKLEFNHIKMLDQGVLLGLSSLTRLRLRNNRISYLHPQALSGLSNLLELDLTNNLLSAVPTANLQDVRSLKILRLGGNRITKVKGWAFDGIPITTLDLSNNITPLQLSKHSFCGLEPIYRQENDTRIQIYSLQAVSLANNGLQHVTPCGDTIIHANYLELTGNPLQCDCDLMYLRDMGRMNKGGLTNIKCAGPPNLQNRYVSSLSSDKLGCRALQTRQSHNCLDPAAFCARNPKDLAVFDGGASSASRTSPVLSLLFLLFACVAVNF